MTTLPPCVVKAIAVKAHQFGEFTPIIVKCPQADYLVTHTWNQLYVRIIATFLTVIPDIDLHPESVPKAIILNEFYKINQIS